MAALNAPYGITVWMMPTKAINMIIQYGFSRWLAVMALQYDLQSWFYDMATEEVKMASQYGCPK